MTESINQGDFEAYPAGTQMLVRVRSGEVKLGDHPNTAQRQIASYTPDNGWISWTPSHAERLVVYAVEAAEVDVQYNDGFSISLFGLPVLDVDAGSPNTPDYRNQTVRIPAEGVVEVNNDQTDSISGGGSDTATTVADTGEVWMLRAFHFSWSPSDSSWDGEIDDNVQITVRTEEQGIELGFFDVNQISTSTTLGFNTSGWFASGGNPSVQASRDNIEDRHRIDDDSGIEVVFNIGVNANPTSETRQIRYAFDVIRA